MQSWWAWLQSSLRVPHYIVLRGALPLRSSITAPGTFVLRDEPLPAFHPLPLTIHRWIPCATFLPRGTKLLEPSQLPEVACYNYRQPFLWLNKNVSSSYSHPLNQALPVHTEQMLFLTQLKTVRMSSLRPPQVLTSNHSSCDALLSPSQTRRQFFSRSPSPFWQLTNPGLLQSVYTSVTSVLKKAPGTG